MRMNVRMTLDFFFYPNDIVPRADIERNYVLKKLAIGHKKNYRHSARKIQGQADCGKSRIKPLL